MPLIPGVNQRSVTPNAADTPYFKIDTTADEFGAGIGKSLLSLGTSLGDASKTIAKFKPKQDGDAGVGGLTLPMPQFDPDLSQAIDLTNTFNAGAQDLQNRFLQLSGKDAVDGQADAQQGIDQLQSSILANAQTPTAADAARPAVAHWASAAKSVIDRHATAQQRVYDDGLDDTQIAQGRSSVGLLYNDDPNYVAQLHVASQARADQVLRAAANDNATADPDTIAASVAAARQATASNFTRARIEGALDQGDVATATALHQRWGGDLLPADQQAVSQHLTYAQFNHQAQQATAQVMAINQPAPLGQRRNADVVLHRRGGASAGDQVADAGSAGGQDSASSTPADALSPLSAEPDAPEAKLDKGERDERALQYPEGGWDAHSPGERMAMGPHAMEAEAALKNNRITPAEVSPLPIDLKVNPRNATVGQGEGHYGDNRDAGARSHEGLDLAAPVGTPVFAVKGGTVLFVRDNLDPVPAGLDTQDRQKFYEDGLDAGYGNQVVIQHPDGSITVYAHLRPIKDVHGNYVSPVQEGQYVSAGDKIGEVGTTGNLPEGAASHLHFEARFKSVQDIEDETPQNGKFGQSKKDRTTFNPLYLFQKSGITIDGIN